MPCENRKKSKLQFSAMVLSLCFATSPAMAEVSCADWNTGEFFKRASAADVSRCLESGAEVNAGESEGFRWTPLHLAAHGASPDVVNVLLKAGARVHARDRKGWTPLHLAAANNTADVVSALLKGGAFVHLWDEDGERALHWAARHSAFPAVVDALMKAGADIHERDDNGNTPLNLAERHSKYPAVVSALRKVKAEVEAKEAAKEAARKAEAKRKARKAEAKRKAEAARKAREAKEAEARRKAEADEGARRARLARETRERWAREARERRERERRESEREAREAARRSQNDSFQQVMNYLLTGDPFNSRMGATGTVTIFSRKNCVAGWKEPGGYGRIYWNNIDRRSIRFSKKFINNAWQRFILFSGHPYAMDFQANSLGGLIMMESGVPPGLSAKVSLPIGSPDSRDEDV